MCGTVRMQPGERSTSDPMFIRVFPLFVYLHSQYFHIWHFESPVVKRSASLKIPSIMLPFSSRTHLKNMHSQCASTFRPHVYQGFPYVYIYITQFPAPFVHILSPVINIPSSWSVPPRILVLVSSWNRPITMLLYLHTQYSHIWHFESPVVRCSDSVYVRPCADATWWKIHLRPHAYKGFPFICLSKPPIFPYYRSDT